MGGTFMEELNLKALAFGLGITFALYMLVAGWLAMFGWGGALVEAISSVYIGFAPTFAGGIIGALWGFIDGAIGGALIAIIYNWVARKQPDLKNHV
jgi:hypothetical protein